MPPARAYVVGLVASVALLGACGSGGGDDTSSPAPTPATTMTAAVATPRDVEIHDARLVLNIDGSATLVATFVNHTDTPRSFAEVVDRDFEPSAGSPYPVRLFGADRASTIPAGGTATTGHRGDTVLARYVGDVTPGDDIALSLRFDDDELDMVEASVSVPVVARTAADDDIVGNEPITSIDVQQARVVVIPGQKQAYFTGSFVGDVQDWTYDLPTATRADGRQPVTIGYRTATGGPYSVSVEPDEPTPFGRLDSFLAPEEDTDGGDTEHVLADDVTIGETLLVTFAFQSGDVTIPFSVVAGSPDGTIAD